MSRSGGNRQSRTSGGATKQDGSTGVVPERIADDEAVVYRLAGSGEIRHERDEGSDRRLSPADGGSTLAVVTDRRLLFAAVAQTGPEVVEVPYRNVRAVDAAGGLLRSRFVVRVWDEGTLRFKPARGQPVAEAGEFVDRAKDVWQRALAAIDDAREHVSALGAHVEAGDADAAADALEAVRAELSRAERRIDGASDELREALEGAIADAETELQRTRVHAHLSRGMDRAEAGELLADEAAWSDAEAALVAARRHFETAREAAEAGDLGLVEAIDQEIDQLEDLAQEVADRPRRRAASARATAEAADDPEEAIPAWTDALEGYRAAVTFDWGGRLGAERDVSSLRLAVEETAANLIASRRQLANDLLSEGDDARMAGEPQAARDRYAAAFDQLVAATRVAEELRVGDADALRGECELVSDRLDAVRNRVAASGRS